MDIKLFIEVKKGLGNLFEPLEGIEVSIFNEDVYKMLANVNNEDEKIKSIMDFYGPYRGVPVDATKEYVELVKQHKGKFHHFYYLKELVRVKEKGYLKLKDENDNTYEELAKDFLVFMDKLSEVAEERNICFYCIRINFFFIKND